MTPYERQLIRELLRTLVAVAVVVTVIVSSHRLAGLLGRAAEGEIPAELVLALLGLGTFNVLLLMLPLAFYLGTLLTLGRMRRDRELLAWSALGMAPLRLYRPLLAVALPLAGLTGLMTLFVAPELAQRYFDLRYAAEAEADVALLRPGQFHEFQNGRIVVYASALSSDRGELLNLFLSQRDENGQVTLQTAARGYLTAARSGSRYVILEQGQLLRGRPGSKDYLVVDYERHAIRLDSDRSSGRERLETVPTAELLARADDALRAELHWRLASPIAIIVLAILALPLSLSGQTNHRTGPILTASLVYLVYANSLSLARSWTERGLDPLELGLSWVHPLPLLLAAILLWTQRHRRRRPPPSS